ncbi:hypothetical protein BAUCODRAFT_35436 [Baudoinia panamericana UAMH 10762]|uniref:Uncharacterized protein n=1 Tax=Baudoinia panamericana (strain UAMH 10762) TaxID=717646 RepID=M2N9H0_BAUPA|nr:uncharacterized protein BAUCODRAFT_35436 [Baudoinia panamericana UAMH 10762]EMC95460.1 hypothetical protein BAUCODRAFT_35436 [Baudoinia panamericana UAMH 10762]
MPAHSPHLSSIHATSDPFTSAMSVTILPSSPMTCSQAPVPALLPMATVPSKKPKLSLDTTNTSPLLRGKASTSLRLETLSATSPTIRNTFRNGPDAVRSARRPALRPALTPLTTSVPSDPIRKPTPIRTEAPNSAESADLSSSASSVASVSTVDSLASAVPYTVAFNLNSILSNGPIPRAPRRVQLRPMFPRAKKVAFRAPLTEDIETSKYTLSHYDVASSMITHSTPGVPPSQHREDEDVPLEEPRHEGVDAVAHMTLDETSHLSANPEAHAEGDADETVPIPCTPVAGRNKRDREWCWTLGPVDSSVSAIDQRHERGIDACEADAKS